MIWGFSWRKLPWIALWCRRQKMPLPPTLQRKISQIATKPREFSPSKVSHYTGCLSSSQPQNHAGLLPRLAPVIHYFPPCSSMPSLVCAFTDIGEAGLASKCSKTTAGVCLYKKYAAECGPTKVEYRMLLKQPVLESTAHELKKLYLLSKLQTLNPQSIYFTEIHRIYSSKLYYFTCSPHEEGD